jgi:EEF1A lysine methyltransferase 4
MPSAANYLGTADYWTERVRSEGMGGGQGFDWLLSSDNSGFRTFISDATKEASAKLAATPRILHLGPGSSRLSLWMRDLVDRPDHVVHFDFAESAKELGERWERECWPDAGEERMRWMTGDLLELPSVLGISQRLENTERSEGVEAPSLVLFDILVDKGTLDAISCVEALIPGDELAGRIRSFAPDISPKILKTPIYSSLMVALNLATISRPGAAWIILSYGGTRFDAFTARVRPETPTSLEELASRLWRLEIRQELEESVPEAKDESNGEFKKPKIYHWFYLLRRTNVPF